MKHQGNEHNFKNPVCGMEVSRTTAVEEFVYQGRTFCAGRCSRRSPRVHSASPPARGDAEASR